MGRAVGRRWAAWRRSPRRGPPTRCRTARSSCFPARHWRLTSDMPATPQIPSLLPEVIDALVTLARAWPGLGNGQDDSPPVYVYDGPEVQQTNPKAILWVGMDDPDSDSAPIGGETEQNFAGLGTMARDEEGNVH